MFICIHFYPPLSPHTNEAPPTDSSRNYRSLSLLLVFIDSSYCLLVSFSPCVLTLIHLRSLKLKRNHHDDVQTAAEWEGVFIIAGMIHFFGVIFYAIFASGELQDWAEPPAAAAIDPNGQQPPSSLPPAAANTIVAAGVPNATTTVTNDPYTQWNTNTAAAVQQNNPFGQANGGVAYDAQQQNTGYYAAGTTDYTQQPQQPSW